MKKSNDTSKKTMAELAKETREEAMKDPGAKRTTGGHDVTGQTHTTVDQMKKRLQEVPKKSAATKHDKAAYEEE